MGRDQVRTKERIQKEKTEAMRMTAGEMGKNRWICLGESVRKVESESEYT